MKNYLREVPTFVKMDHSDPHCNAQPAFDQGLGIFNSAMEEKYRKVGKVKLFAFIDGCLDLLHERGFLLLVDDDLRNIPSDSFIDIALKPAYGLAACIFYAAERYPKDFDVEARREKISLLLDGCMVRNLRDHGYEAAEGFVNNLLVLCKGGLGSFVAKHPDINPKVENELRKMVEKTREQYLEAEKAGQKVLVWGWGNNDVTERVKALLEAYDKAS